MKASSSISAAANTDKAYASSGITASSAAAQQSASGEGFLAMLDGLLQTATSTGQGSFEASDQTGSQAAQDNAAIVTDDDANDGNAVESDDVLLPASQQPILAALPVPPEAISFTTAPCVVAAQTVKAAADQDTTAPAGDAALSALAAQAGMVPLQQPIADAAQPAALDKGASTQTASTPVNPATIPAAGPSVARSVPVTSPISAGQVLPAAQPVTSPALPVTMQAASGAASAQAAGEDTVTPAPASAKPAKAASSQSDDQANSDTQQSAILAALFAQAPPQTLAPATVSASHSGATAGPSSVPGAGIPPTLSPPPAGNGTHLADPLEQPAVQDDAGDAPALPASHGTATQFGIGTASAEQQAFAASGNDPQSDSQQDPNASAVTPQAQAVESAKAQEIANLFMLPQETAGKAPKSNTVSDDGKTAMSIAPVSNDNSGILSLGLVHQPGSLGATGSVFAAGSSLATAYTTAGTPADQISVVMQRLAGSGTQSMTIALDPLELGKVEVKLDFAKDGTVQASVTAERPETLTLLKNDHSTLTQALQNAGLATNSGSLSFNLRDGGSSQHQQQASANTRSYRNRDSDAADTTPQIDTTKVQYAVSGGIGRLNLFA